MQLTTTGAIPRLGFLSFLINILPHKIQEHMKRTIFVFSVLAVLDKTFKGDKSAIRDINDRLKLAKTEGICKTSINARGVIWGSENDSNRIPESLPTFDTSMSRKERTSLSEYYVNHCPDWLRYGASTGSDMVRDLHRLFNALIDKDSD